MVDSRDFELKILHTSHKGLPDQRIEREAYIAKSRCHTVKFLGLGAGTTPELDVFSEISMLRSINNRQAALDKRIRREWQDAVDDINPDVIHANDIIAAKFSSGTSYPMVYDDHEYWSKQVIVYKNWAWWKRLAIRPLLKAIPLWENEILSNYVTMTVSEAIANEHRAKCPAIFVLQNYVLRSEVDSLPANENRDGIAYVGNDFVRSKFAPHRNMAGLTDWVEFDSLYGLRRDSLYQNLVNYRFGLLPFKSNRYSKYSNSAKVFDYLNCGVQVLMTRALYDAHGQLPYTYPFDHYSEIPTIIDSTEYVSPSEIMKYAHDNLVWEVQENLLLKAYDMAIVRGKRTLSEGELL